MLADWKSGTKKPDELSLDHGYQLGLYAEALAKGTFYKGTPREFRVDQYPDQLFIAHLRDAVPYMKSGSKEAKHRDDLVHYGVSHGTKVAYKAGDRRGPVWYRAQRSEHDIARLRVSVRTLVSTMRMGFFLERIGDACARCAFRDACLNQGYGPEGAEKKQLDDAIRGLEFDGFGEDFAA